MRVTNPVRASLSAVSPLFIVSDLQDALTFYRDRLGFEVTYQAPAPDPFMAIVARDGVQLMLKMVAKDVGAVPNRSRHPDARWDAYVHVPDPDALAAEFRGQGVTFSAARRRRRTVDYRERDMIVWRHGEVTSGQWRAGQIAEQVPEDTLWQYVYYSVSTFAVASITHPG